MHKHSRSIDKSRLLQNTSFSLSASDNMKVMIRIRPPLPRETEPGVPFRSIVEVSDSCKTLKLVEYLGTQTDELERQHELIENPSLFQLHIFNFDYIFDIPTTQEEVYEKCAKLSVSSVLEGYNSTIFAYGQTGTGKTHTMEGFTYLPEDPERGIVPRCIEEIFSNISSSCDSNTKFIIRVSYLQIYNEYISDLLKPENHHLNIREDKKKGIYVDGLSEWVVRNPNDIYSLLEQGAEFRATSSTLMNDVSSRSHAIFIITVEQLSSMLDGSTCTKVAKLNLVDLAGSERIRVTGAKGKQLEESKRINKSLSALGNVINALTDPKGSHHIPYRDSKLTRLLADSLGGNCKTTMITTISPCHDFFSESLSSLLFAKRAKKIKNRPIINQDLNHRALISQYEFQLRNLRKELEEKNRLLESNELLLELEQTKKRAEEDKILAMKKLEEASMQYLHEREEKNKLEMKIQLMSSQMITGGSKIEEMPQFRSALEERRNILMKEFDNKLQEFEKERTKLEEDKAEVERYKDLLLKQRDIMITLTTKLNERDETIVQLQEEMEVYEVINHQQEEILDLRLKNIKTLCDLLKQKGVEIPPEVSSITQEEQAILNKKSKPTNTKKYLSYEAEKNRVDNGPLTMLSAEEKIKELKLILKEQENQISILKLVSQKFLATSCESEDGKIDLNSIIKRLEGGFELHSKIREIEQEKLSILADLEKQNETNNCLKNEIENLNEQVNTYERLISRNEKEISSNNDLLTHINCVLADLLSNSYDSFQTKTELTKINNMVIGAMSNSLNISGGGFTNTSMSLGKSGKGSLVSLSSVIDKSSIQHQNINRNKIMNVSASNYSGNNTISSNTFYNRKNVGYATMSKTHSDNFISKFINASK